MVLGENKAKRLLLVSHITKIIHHHKCFKKSYSMDFSKFPSVEESNHKFQTYTFQLYKENSTTYAFMIFWNFYSSLYQSVS